MTPLESWIVNNALEIAALVIIGIIAWSRTGKADKLEKELKEHKESPTPHLQCPAHASTLTEIKEAVEEVKKRLDTIDDRIFALVSQHGGSDERQGTHQKA